jgi:hypothetical protein
LPVTRERHLPARLSHGLFHAVISEEDRHAEHFLLKLSQRQDNEESMSTQKFSQTNDASSPGGNRPSADRMTGMTATVTSQVQDVLDQQVIRGAKTMTNVAQSARRAADELESDAPQIAGLVRGIADRVEEYSHQLEDQSITDIYQSASEFTRRQPAVVFGVAALAGFLALRTLKSAKADASPRTRTSHLGGVQSYES